MFEHHASGPSAPFALAFLMGGAALAAPLLGASPAVAATPLNSHFAASAPGSEELADSGSYSSFDEAATLQVSIDADTGTGTGMLRVVAPAGGYSIEASLEGEVTFADGSRTAVFTGDQVSAPIPLRLTAHQGSAAVGLAAVMPVTGLERWAPDRPRHRAGAMQVVSGAVAVPFH